MSQQTLLCTAVLATTLATMTSSRAAVIISDNYSAGSTLPTSNAVAANSGDYGGAEGVKQNRSNSQSFQPTASGTLKTISVRYTSTTNATQYTFNFYDLGLASGVNLDAPTGTARPTGSLIASSSFTPAVAPPRDGVGGDGGFGVATYTFTGDTVPLLASHAYLFAFDTAAAQTNQVFALSRPATDTYASGQYYRAGVVHTVSGSDVDIDFAVNVPEPASLSLLALAGGWMLRRRRM